ncbi:response regulator transcription factor [Thalassobaculum sp.]|uniref:response regulator transcription factor n=1 Tax=Thalassobaculum sp. TaxID=2022740 RepID=UPI0032EB3476
MFTGIDGIAMQEIYRTAILGHGRLFQEGLRSVLSGTAYHSVVVTENVISPPDDVGQIDLVLLISCCGSEWSDAEIGAAKSAWRPRKAIVIADRLEKDRFIRALLQGVDGYLLNNVSAAAFVQSLNVVMAGGGVFPSNLLGLLSGLGDPNRAAIHLPDSATRLSVQDRELIGLLAGGLSNKEIAAHLRRSLPTVKVLVKTLLRRLNLSNRTQAAVWARTRATAPSPSGLGLWRERAHASTMARLPLRKPCGVPDSMEYRSL